jgi:hypothetical protein
MRFIYVALILVLALMASMHAAATPAPIAHITKVDWPDSEIHTNSITIMVTVKNTGAETATFNAKFAIQDPNGKWYEGDCNGNFVHSGKEAVFYPGIEILHSMPAGHYNARVVLYGDHCFINKMDIVTKQSAFLLYPRA